jgi:hypothetical protein
MATTVFNASAASNGQATVLTAAGSASNSVPTSMINPVIGGVGVTSSHLGIARPQSGGLLAPDSLQTVTDIPVSTAINDHQNLALRDITTGLDEASLASNNFIVRYDGLFVDSTNTVYTAAAISSVASSTVTLNTPSDGSMITAFNGSVPAANSY